MLGSIGLNAWVAALLSDQTGLGMAVELLLCLYKSPLSECVRMSPLHCVTCHRCDMRRRIVFEFSKPKTSHQDGALTDRGGSIDRNEKRGTLLGLHVVCPAPVTLIVTSMARSWVRSLIVRVVVTAGIRASRILVIGSERERLGRRLCVHVGIVGRKHISGICASFRNNQGR